MFLNISVSAINYYKFEKSNFSFLNTNEFYQFRYIKLRLLYDSENREDLYLHWQVIQFWIITNVRPFHIPMALQENAINTTPSNNIYESFILFFTSVCVSNHSSFILNSWT